MKNYTRKPKLFFLFAVMACFIISGCSNSQNKENTDDEKITAGDTNVFEGNFWRNQALTDIMPTG